MSHDRKGTLLCGWCLGPPGARRPHRFGIPSKNCPCGCHRKPRKIETAEAIVTFMEGGEDDAA